MRIAAFADVQGNVGAAEALLGAFRRLGDTEAYALGNVVGAGPHPSETVRLLRKGGVHLVLGPHDLAALGRPPREHHREMGERNMALLSPSDLAWLKLGGPARRVVVNGRGVLLSADPSPQVGTAKLVLFPGEAPRVEARDGVVHACVGRADHPSGEAPYVVHDTQTGETRIRHAVWDVDAPRARTRHL